jgi:hypothetical protein
MAPAVCNSWQPLFGGLMIGVKLGRRASLFGESCTPKYGRYSACLRKGLSLRKIFDLSRHSRDRTRPLAGHHLLSKFSRRALWEFQSIIDRRSLSERQRRLSISVRVESSRFWRDNDSFPLDPKGVSSVRVVVVTNVLNTLTTELSDDVVVVAIIKRKPLTIFAAHQYLTAVHTVGLNLSRVDHREGLSLRHLADLPAEWIAYESPARTSVIINAVCDEEQRTQADKDAKSS